MKSSDREQEGNTGIRLGFCAGVVVVVAALALATAGVAAAGGAGPADVATDDSVDNETEVSQDVYETDGATELVLRLPEQDERVLTASAEPTVALQEHAERTQQPVVDSLTQIDGVQVNEQFWATNAILVSVETTDDRTIDRLAALDSVEQIHRNFEVQTPGPVEHELEGAAADRLDERHASITDESDDVTYGLDQIDVPEARDEFGTTGDGVRVAVLDTGVDPDHPDIDLAGYAAFDEEGNLIPDAEPRDSNGHGTHVSGTVTGGNASGTQIGVAPDAELYHGRVLDEGGTFAQINAGIQWAILEADADVLVLSLGTAGYEDAMLESIQSAQAEDITVVVAAGNDGEGSSSSPGNYPESFSVGATNEFEDIAFFSSGEEIVTDDLWDDPPSEWPEEYVVPDVSAPGFGVLSALPDGEYGLLDGTSMAAPHVAGVAALAQEANPEADREAIENAIERTTRKPDGDSDQRDPRYGFGIVDARSTVEFVTTDTGVNGTVTKDDEPVDGIGVELVGGYTVTTDETGAFDLVAQPGEATVRIDEFGFEAVEETVTVPEEGAATVDLSITPTVDAIVNESPPASVIAGEESVDASFDVVNADSITIERGGDYGGEPALYINGERHDFGEEVPVDDGTVNTAVTTSPEASGTIELTYQIDGTGGSVTENAATFVENDPVRVAVVGDREDDDLPAEIAASISDDLPQGYFADPVDVDELPSAFDEYDAAVVNSLPADDAQTDAILDVTEQRSYPAVYLELEGATANATTRVAERTGDPAAVEYDSSFDTEHGLVPGDGSHPIFEDIPDQPDGLSIHTDDGDDHAFVDGASGETIATVTLGGQPQGDAMVVDADTNTAIAAGFGRADPGFFVGEDDYTDTSNRILATTVGYLYETDLGTVTGTVTTPDGEPVPGVTVTHTDDERTRTTTTDENGTYELVVNETTGDMEATAFQFEPDSQSDVTVTAGETTTVDFEIEPFSGTLTGTVTDDDGEPIENATIEVTDSDGGIIESTGTEAGGPSVMFGDGDEPIREATTDADGQYEVDVPIGTYDIEIDRFKYDGTTIDGVEIQQDETTTEDASLTLLPTRTLTGEVTDEATNDTIAAATVELLDDGAVVRATTTNDTGVYSMDVPVGTHTLVVDADAYAPTETQVDVDEEPTVEDVALVQPLDVEIAEPAPETVAVGETIPVAFDAENVETLTVSRAGDYNGDLGLAVYDVDQAFDQPFSDLDSEVPVEVFPDDDATGTVSLTYEFERGDDSVTLTTETVVKSIPTEPGDYAGDDGTVDLDGVRSAINDWQDGTIDTDLLVDVIDAWAAGEQVGASTQTALAG